MFSGILLRSEKKWFNIFGSIFLAILSNIFTILIQIVAGRSLPLSSLSAFLTVWTFYSLIALSTTGVQTSTAIQISKSKSWKSHELAREKSWLGLDQFSKKVSVIGILVTTFLILFTPIVAGKMSIAPTLYLMACLSLVPQALFAIAVGRLQGRYEFLIVNVFGATSTFVRFLTTAIVLQISQSAEAVILGNVLVTFVFSIACFVNQKFNYIPNNKFSLWDTVRTTKILLAFWVIFNLDVFTSRLLPEGAYYESYAAASSLARTILIPVVLLTAALIPKLASGLKVNEGRLKGQVFMHACNLGLASFIALVIWLFSNDLTKLLLGESNQEVEFILRLLSIAYLPYAVIYSMLNRNLALGIHDSILQLTIPAMLGIGTFMLLELPINDLPIAIFFTGVSIICNIQLWVKCHIRISKYFKRT